MPSFNPRTKKMRYTKADVKLIGDCVSLLDAIGLYDSQALKDICPNTASKLMQIAKYIDGADKTDAKPAEKPKLASA